MGHGETETGQLVIEGDFKVPGIRRRRRILGEDLTLEAEVRLNHSPMGATREIITTSLSRSSAPPELSVMASAWVYDSAEHSLPVARQSVTEVRPSDRLVEDARRVLETCGVEAGLGS